MGTFYKSAALQGKYEQLWNLGACRGTFKGTTQPVAENKLSIDSLPESRFTGTVRAATGRSRGGLIVFDRIMDAGDEPLVVQLHPAGVTRLRVTGTASAAILRLCMTVRFVTRVDAHGVTVDAVQSIELVSPARRGHGDGIVAGEVVAVTGVITHVRPKLVGLRLDAGRIRRLTVHLADDAMVAIDTSIAEFVAHGDAIEVTGRLWSGPGSMAAGPIFASDVVVRKPAVAR